MDMAKKNMPDLFEAQSGGAKFGFHILKSRFRPGVEQNKTVVGFQRGRSDDAATVQMKCVQNVNHELARNRKLETIDCESNAGKDRKPGRRRVKSRPYEGFDPGLGDETSAEHGGVHGGEHGGPDALFARRSL